MNKMTYEFADEMMNRGFHCSQVVMMHAAELLGMDRDLLVRLSAGLGGGLFRGEACGAVSAAVVALSAVYGYSEEEPGEIDAVMKQRIHELEDAFEKEHGSILCRELMDGLRLNIPEEAAQITDQNLWARCPAHICTACDLLDRIVEAVK